MKFKLIGAVSAAVALLTSAAFAEDYPSKTIEVVTHAGNGGGTDVTTRMMMLRARRALKQDMVIVNKKGGGGDAARDAAHGQVAPAPIGQHHRGHDQPTQAGQDRSGETRRIEACANGGVWREFGAEGGVGQVDAGVRGHQQHRHHGVIERALPHAARGNPLSREEEDIFVQRVADILEQPPQLLQAGQGPEVAQAQQTIKSEVRRLEE